MKKELDKIEMYTDGACSGNPGPGGWGTILRFGSAEKELSGGERSTTNNRMELTAVIEGFKALICCGRHNKRLGRGLEKEGLEKERRQAGVEFRFMG